MDTQLSGGLNELVVQKKWEDLQSEIYQIKDPRVLCILSHIAVREKQYSLLSTAVIQPGNTIMPLNYSDRLHVR